MSSRSRHHSKSRCYRDKHWRHTNTISKLRGCENMPHRVYAKLVRTIEAEKWDE